jgi:uncharacterized protein (TIGR03067 family)
VDSSRVDRPLPGDAMRRFVIVIATLSTTLLWITGCGKKESVSNGNAVPIGDSRLEGIYTLVATEMGGVSTQEYEKDRNYEFSGNKMISPKGKKEEAATINCDPAQTPAEITITKTEASGKIDTFFGIYKLENGTLTLCMIKSDNPIDRPKEFKTNKDSKAIILVMKKTK